MILVQDMMGYCPLMHFWWPKKSFYAKVLVSMSVIWFLVSIGQTLIEPVLTCSWKLKVMIACVDVLGTRAETWKPSNFKCTRVILKNLPINVGLYIGNIKFMLPLFLDEFHEGNDVMKGHNHGYILLFVCRKHNLWQQLGGPNDGAVCLKHNPSTPRELLMLGFVVVNSLLQLSVTLASQ